MCSWTHIFTYIAFHSYDNDIELFVKAVDETEIQEILSVWMITEEPSRSNTAHVSFKVLIQLRMLSAIKASYFVSKLQSDRWVCFLQWAPGRSKRGAGGKESVWSRWQSGQVPRCFIRHPKPGAREERHWLRWYPGC
jgi:hypothetical protein